LGFGVYAPTVIRGVLYRVRTSTGKTGYTLVLSANAEEITMHYTLKDSDDKGKAEGTHGAGALQQKLLESRSIVISVRSTRLAESHHPDDPAAKRKQ
jgi:hypothetical protein